MCSLEDPVTMDLFICFTIILMSEQSLGSGGLKIHLSSASPVCYVDTHETQSAAGVHIHSTSDVCPALDKPFIIFYPSFKASKFTDYSACLTSGSLVLKSLTALNGRMAWAGRDLKAHPNPTPTMGWLPPMGAQVAQGPIQLSSLNILCRRRAPAFQASIIFGVGWSYLGTVPS